MPLEGKVALVTGAGRNMGRSIALDFARRGVRVAVHARSNAQEVEQVVAEVKALGADALGVLGDIGSRAEVERIVGAATEALGPIDILINTVATRPPQKSLEINDQDLERVLSVNLYGPFRAAQAVLPGMVKKQWGRIVNFSGLGVFGTYSPSPHFAMSKTGIIGLTRSLALEFAPHGITVNTIVPGSFDTKRVEQWELPGRVIPTHIRRPMHTPPAGRFGMPEEIAALCTFLVSDEAGFITGQSIHVNGGAYLT